LLSTALSHCVGHQSVCDQTRTTTISGGLFTAALGGFMIERTNEKEAAKGSGLVELSLKRSETIPQKAAKIKLLPPYG
jgi:hypothetical protein